MKKALVYAPTDLRIVDLPERDPGPGEVKVNMILSTLTTANVRIYQGPLLADLKYPATLSYTGVGEVAETGSGVTKFKPGDLVYPNFYRACLKCRWCKADKYVACENVALGEHNMMVGEKYESGLQESIIFPEERFYPIPAGTPLEKVALTGFLSVAMQAITAIQPDDKETLFINGAGPLGWCSTQLAKLTNTKVVISEVRPTRMERARILGADVVIDATKPDAKEQVMEACGGAPLKLIEASGTREGSAFTFDVAGRGAHIAVIGVTDNPITQHFFIMKGLRVDGIGGAIKVQETINLIAAGKIDISSAISHRFPFSKLKEAFELKRSTPEVELVAIYMDESRLPAGS